MKEIDRSVRMRAFLSDRLFILLILFLVVALGAGWWAYQVHMVPEYEQQQRTVDEWSETSEFDHQATIIQDSLIWEEGEVVENRPLYYTNLSEELEGTYTYRLEASEGSAEVTSEAVFYIRAFDDEEIYWEYAEPLASSESSTIQAGDSHTLEFTLDIIEILETIDQIETELGAQEGLIDPRVEIYSEVSGEVEGDALDATRQSEMAIVVNPDTYRVNEMETVDEPHQDIEVIDVPVDPTPGAQLGSFVFFLLALFGLVTLVVGSATGRFDITKEEQELLELAREREEFDEWITTGRFPADRDYEMTILVDNLVGLVDVAIDTNNRVIEDSELGVSAVLDGDSVYLYVHPNSPAREWLINYADTTLDEL